MAHIAEIALIAFFFILEIVSFAKSAVWEISHWVSTHLCMNLMAMRTGNRLSAHPCGSPIGTANLADDMRIRCDAALAGMARAALLHSVMKLHHKNMLWLVAPSIDQVLDCAAEYQRFMDDVKVARQARTVDPRMKNHEGRERERQKNTASWT